MDVVATVILIVLAVFAVWYMNMLDRRARARQRLYDDMLLYICSGTVSMSAVADFRFRLEKLRLTPLQLVRYNIKHRNDGVDK